MSNSLQKPAATGLNRFLFRSVDWVVIATIAVAFGIIFKGFGSLYDLLSATFVFLPPLVGLMAGLWCLPAIIAALIIRKPGAALFGELVAASAEALLGGQWGWNTLVSGVLQGLGVEIGFAIFAFASFSAGAAMLAGFLSTGFEWCFEAFWYYPEWAMNYKLILLACFLVSGALLCGLLGHAIVRALAPTGALNAFGPGQDYLRNQRG